MTTPTSESDSPSDEPTPEQTPTARPRMISATPAFPVSNIDRAVDFYTGRLGFGVGLHTHDYAIVSRDDLVIHLWLAAENGGQDEPRIAGSASCRVLVSGIGVLHGEMRDRKVVHPNGELGTRAWGTREFTVLDADGNALTFYAPRG